jgi:hypothetical protein
MGRDVFLLFEYGEPKGEIRPIEGRRPNEVDGRHGMSLAVAERCRDVLRVELFGLRGKGRVRVIRDAVNMMMVVVCCFVVAAVVVRRGDDAK